MSFTYDRTKWQFFDKAVEDDYNRLKKVADGEIQIVSRTLDDKKWLVAFLMDDGPVRYYYYDRDTKEPKFLFTNRKDLEDQPLQKMHPVVIDARDGLNLVSYLTLPPGSDPEGQLAGPISRCRWCWTCTADRGRATVGGSIRNINSGPTAAMRC